MYLTKRGFFMGLRQIQNHIRDGSDYREATRWSVPFILKLFSFSFLVILLGFSDRLNRIVQLLVFPYLQLVRVIQFTIFLHFIENLLTPLVL